MYCVQTYFYIFYMIINIFYILKSILNVFIYNGIFKIYIFRKKSPKGLKTVAY